MKKTLSVIMAAAMTIGGLSLYSVSASDEAEVIVENGLEYYAAGDSVMLLKGAEDKKISTVTIPASVNGKKVIADSGVFSDCPNLSSINVDSKNADLSSVDGVLFDSAKSRLLSYPRGLKGEYSIPDGTVSIAENAFENALSLTKINIPETLTSVGAYAFKNCTSLTGFSAPLPLMQSGDSLYGCTALKSVELAEIPQPTAIANLRFEKCTELEKVVIPRNYILSGAFRLSECPKLKEVVLPEYASVLLLTIKKCDQLSSFAMPECHNADLTSYSNVAISECPEITELELSNARRITVENMSSLKVLKLSASPYADKNDVYNKIDYSTCPKLKDIYLYNADVQPTPKEAELMAENGITVHCRNTSNWGTYLDKGISKNPLYKSR